MNGRERVLLALQRKEPDRVPHFEWSIAQNVINAAPIWPKFAWGYESFIEYMDIDAVCAWQIFRLKKVKEDIFRDNVGILRKIAQEDYGMAIESEAPIKCSADLSNFRFPDPEEEDSWIQLKGFVKRFKGEKAIIMKLRDVFSWPRELRGFEALMMDLAFNRDLVIELVTLAAEYGKKCIKIASELGAEIIVTADDIAYNNGLFFSPQDFRELFLPSFKEMVSYAKGLGLYFIKHTDGDITCLLQDFVDAGIDCIDPIDPLGSMSLLEVKKQFGDKICLKGNVPCAGVLDGLDITKVIDETRRCITEAAAGGGYILSSSNSIHAGVPFENYKAMLQTNFEFGQYKLKK